MLFLLVSKMDKYGLDEELEYREGINPLKVAKGLGHGGLVVLGGATTGLGQYRDKFQKQPKGVLRQLGQRINDLGTDNQDESIDYLAPREGVVMAHPLLEALAIKNPAASALISSTVNAGITENRGGEYTPTDRAIDYIAFQLGDKGYRFAPAFKENFEKLGTTYKKELAEQAIEKMSRALTSMATNQYLHKALDDEYKFDDY